jgi:hypothetical protein
LGESVHSLKEKGESYVVTSKVIGLEANADKAKYMVMSQGQNAEKSHNIRLMKVTLKGWKSSKNWEQT